MSRRKKAALAIMVGLVGVAAFVADFVDNNFMRPVPRWVICAGMDLDGTADCLVRKTEGMEGEEIATYLGKRGYHVRKFGDGYGFVQEGNWVASNNMKRFAYCNSSKVIRPVKLPFRDSACS